MNIIIFGPPGSGKGTQSQRLKENYGLMHLSTGEMLRSEIAKGTALGKSAQDIMDSGQFIPDDIIIAMISSVLDRPDYQVGVILDGFPRTAKQAIALDQMFSDKKRSLDHVIEIKVDDACLLKRIVGRFSCAECGAGYNEYYCTPSEPDICDVCGASNFKRRADDSRENVRIRLENYRKETLPILPYYLGKGVLKEVDGMKTVDEVTKQIEDIISGR